jgi:hypothetical protein
VLQHRACLLEGDSREQSNELSDRDTVFEILEKSRYRHARALKYPSAAYALRVAFDGCTGGPIDHRADDSTPPELRRLTIELTCVRRLA